MTLRAHTGETLHAVHLRVMLASFTMDYTCKGQRSGCWHLSYTLLYPTGKWLNACHLSDHRGPGSYSTTASSQHAIQMKNYIICDACVEGKP